MGDEPRVSKDGRFFWDGEKWAPMPKRGVGDSWPPVARAVVGIALGLLVMYVVFALLSH